VLKLNFKQDLHVGNNIFLIMTVFWDAALCSLVEMTDVSEVLTASIIRAISTRLYDTTSQKTAIFLLTTVKS
jgi:hypothetical protein